MYVAYVASVYTCHTYTFVIYTAPLAAHRQQCVTESSKIPAICSVALYIYIYTYIQMVAVVRLLWAPPTVALGGRRPLLMYT